MVGGDQVRQQPAGLSSGLAEAPLQLLDRVHCASGRVTLVALADAAAFDVRVLVQADVLLEARAELAQVMPQTGHVRPGLRARRRTARSELGHRLQVVDQCVIGAVSDGRHGLIVPLCCGLSRSGSDFPRDGAKPQRE